MRADPYSHRAECFFRDDYLADDMPLGYELNGYSATSIGLACYCTVFTRLPAAGAPPG